MSTRPHSSAGAHRGEDDEGDRLVIAPRLLSIDEGAIYLGCSPNTVRRLIETGQISIVRLPAVRDRRGAAHEGTNRRSLLDRIELDDLIPTWRERVSKNP